MLANNLTRRNVKTAAPPSIRELVERKKRKEIRVLHRKTVNSGWKTNLLNTICLFTSAALFLSHFTHLQADADYKLFDPELIFPAFINKELLANLIDYGHRISVVALLIHIIAVKFSKVFYFFI